MNRTNKIIIASAILLVIISFYGGIKYDQGRRTTLRDGYSQMAGRGLGNQNGTSGSQAKGNFGNNVSGEVVTKSDQNLTVKTREGGSRIIFYSQVTEVQKSVAGNISEIEVGKQIMVNGTSNSDGSVTAKTIQLRSDVPNVNPTLPQ